MSRRRHGRSTTRAALVAGAITVLASGLAGCGVPLDSEPRAINPVEETTRPETTPTTSASPAATELNVYFLRDDRLVAEPKPVEGDATVGDALRFLLSGPESSALQTRIPPSTELRSVSITEGEATIDLTDEISGVSGQPGKEAFAQMVFTALEFPEVASVRFQVEGEAVVAPTDDGNLDVVSASNYDPPLNPG